MANNQSGLYQLEETPSNDAKIEVVDLAKSKSAPEKGEKEEMKAEKIEELARPSHNSHSKESP